VRSDGSELQVDCLIADRARRPLAFLAAFVSESPTASKQYCFARIHTIIRRTDHSFLDRS